jgi:DNA-binding LytR/AlgR family response regulator
VDYLVKPLNRGRLMQTIERLKSRLGNDRPTALNTVSNTVREALAAPKSEPKYLRWIQAFVGNLLRLITTDETYFFQADAKYARVVTAHAEALIRKPVKDLMEELNPVHFLQVTRGAIVNLRRVESIYRADGHMEVRLRDLEERLTVSAGYQAAFRQL